jgi:hypothetical protein
MRRFWQFILLIDSWQQGVASVGGSVKQGIARSPHICWSTEQHFHIATQRRPV